VARGGGGGGGCLAAAAAPPSLRCAPEGPWRNLGSLAAAQTPMSPLVSPRRGARAEPEKRVGHAAHPQRYREASPPAVAASMRAPTTRRSSGSRQANTPASSLQLRSSEASPPAVGAAMRAPVMRRSFGSKQANTLATSPQMRLQLGKETTSSVAPAGAAAATASTVSHSMGSEQVEPSPEAARESEELQRLDSTVELPKMPSMIIAELESDAPPECDTTGRAESPQPDTPTTGRQGRRMESPLAQSAHAATTSPRTPQGSSRRSLTPVLHRPRMSAVVRMSTPTFRADDGSPSGQRVRLTLARAKQDSATAAKQDSATASIERMKRIEQKMAAMVAAPVDLPPAPEGVLHELNLTISISRGCEIAPMRATVAWPSLIEE